MYIYIYIYISSIPIFFLEKPNLQITNQYLGFLLVCRAAPPFLISFLCHELFIQTDQKFMVLSAIYILFR